MNSHMTSVLGKPITILIIYSKDPNKYMIKKKLYTLSDILSTIIIINVSKHDLRVAYIICRL